MGGASFNVHCGFRVDNDDGDSIEAIIENVEVLALKRKTIKCVERKSKKSRQYIEKKSRTVSKEEEKRRCRAMIEL